MLPGPLAAGQHRDAIVAEVRRGLEGLARGVCVVVACSGGPDSTALAFLADEAREDLDLVLVHVDHGLRTDGSAGCLVARHADWLGAAARQLHVEVTVRGRGLEAAARDARYAALRSAAGDISAAAILVGHTADDQAETVLLRIARGTGVDGLSAMAPVDGDLVRPMLRLRRGDVAAYLRGEGLTSDADPMNHDERFARVVVRRRVLPQLATISPDPVGALGRLADLAAGDAVLLAGQAREAGVVHHLGEVVILDAHALRRLPRALSRRIVHREVRSLTGRPPAAAGVERVLTAPDAHRGSLPGGVELEARDGWLALALASARRSTDDGAVRLVGAGTYPWPAVGRWLHVEEDPATGGSPPPAAAPGGQPPAGTAAEQCALPLEGTWRPARLAVPASAVPPGGAPDLLALWLPAGLGPAVLRAPRPGDRIRMSGGRRRVVEVLRDAGVPVRLRRIWPVLDVDDAVVWIPGYAADHGLATAGRAEPRLALRLDDSADAAARTAPRPRGRRGATVTGVRPPR